MPEKSRTYTSSLFTLSFWIWQLSLIFRTIRSEHFDQNWRVRNEIVFEVWLWFRSWTWTWQCMAYADFCTIAPSMTKASARVNKSDRFFFSAQKWMLWTRSAETRNRKPNNDEWWWFCQLYIFQMFGFRGERENGSIIIGNNQRNSLNWQRVREAGSDTCPPFILHISYASSSKWRGSKG